MKKWTIEDSKELYNICGWGTSYFGINDKGDVYVTPCKDNTQIDLRDIMDELALRDINAPVLLRFPDILDNRIEKTASCFQKAKEEYGYKGENFVIYPIKVNQMQLRSLRRLSLTARSSTSDWRLALSLNSTPSSPYRHRATRSSSVTATRTRATSNLPCWLRRWASASLS